MINRVTAEQDLRNQLKDAMAKYKLSEFDIARQLSLSLYTVKAFLNGSSTPYYVEKRVEDWLE